MISSMNRCAGDWLSRIAISVAIFAMVGAVVAAEPVKKALWNSWVLGQTTC